MADGTAEDYALLAELEERGAARASPTASSAGCGRWTTPPATRSRRLEHSLQAATRAHRAGEDEETVVCVLLHDIGDHLAPANHSEVAAAVLRPYVSEKNYWIVKHHGVFQGVYYFHFTGADPQRPRPLEGPPLLPGDGRLLRQLRPELVRPRLRLGAAGVLRADGPPRARQAAHVRKRRLVGQRHDPVVPVAAGPGCTLTRPLESCEDPTQGGTMPVLGVGGIFFRASDPDALKAWYREHLGVGAGCAADGAGPPDEWSWQVHGGPLVFAPFEAATDYWAADKQFMLNLRVSDLDSLLEQLTASGIAVIANPEWNDPSVGRFARIHDPEGNAIELWEPPAGPSATT